MCLRLVEVFDLGLGNDDPNNFIVYGLGQGFGLQERGSTHDFKFYIHPSKARDGLVKQI